MKDRIYQVMKTLGKTQKEFASELCIAEGTLSSVFSGRTKPSANIVTAIHECFPDISVTWLMFGEGDMYATHSTVQLTDVDSANVALSATHQINPQAASFLHNQGISQMQMNFDAVKKDDKPQRKITEIRLFFDDGTYEIFEPRNS